MRSTVTLGPRPPYVRIMKELLRTTNPATLAFANALLQGEGIAAFEWDVHMSLLDGGISAFPRRLMVADRDFFMAQAILRDNGVGDG
jgi:Putative prokaryotic signal transducing protein